MDQEIRCFLDNNNLKIIKITIRGNIKIIDVGNNIYVVKKRYNNLDELFNYLKSRNFIFFPKVVFRTDNYDFFEYIDDVKLSMEERTMDMIRIVADLHNRTTFYKDVDEDYYKEVYEKVLGRIDYLYNYYNDIAEIFEKEEFMSPSHYLFLRNYNKLLNSFSYARYNIEEWYKIIKDKKRIRIVNIHNNLLLSHCLISDKIYLISWDKSKKDIPVYDLIKIYKEYYSNIDFLEILRKYELIYPLLLEEKKLFFCLISIPSRIDFNDSEYIMCYKIKELFDYLDMSDNLINEYFPRKKST